MQSWSPSSWSTYTYLQGVEYPDAHAESRVIKTLSTLPPLVMPASIRQLITAMSSAERQEVFLLQGGDCAESFQHASEDIVSKKLHIMHEMSQILTKHLQKPIIQIGRIAGQFAKARSEETETRQGLSLPSYRGDLINDVQFNQVSRTPNPERLLQGYHHSKETLRLISAIKSHNHPFFTSHEALHLPYEEALVRKEDDSHAWYLSSTHLPWIGVRTNQLESAHLEFVRGLMNPIGIKIGPEATPQWLYQVLSRINPQRLSGRVLLITRFGAENLNTYLPPLIELVCKENFPVTWSCDPMHGNTKITTSGFKTREVETIVQELRQTLMLHQKHGSALGGVHLELTGDHVTECTGGARGLQEHHLPHAYQSLVDPRLNDEQSLELALHLGLMHTRT